MRDLPLAQHSATQQMNHIYHPATGAKQTYGRLVANNPSRWKESMANELG
jgi:hypothetical protein